MAESKQADFEDSNISLLNSQLHKDVRLSAAKTEKAWKNSGTQVGIQIWRIEKFKVVDWPKNQYGKFYDGDSYIILHSYKKEKSDKFLYNVHFWLGSNTSQDEAGTAAYKTVELDDYLGDVPVQYREVQGWESKEFQKLFPKIHILSGGIESGFNLVKPTEYIGRLLWVKGKENIRIIQVEPKVSSLNNNDVFILDTGLKIWVWFGSDSNHTERQQAVGLAKEYKLLRQSKPEIVFLDDMEDDDEFWGNLGGKPKTIPETKVDDLKVEDLRKLFKLSDETGELIFTIVAKGPKIDISMLDPKDVFILDEGFQIYVWIGNQASKPERTKAMLTATHYLKIHNLPVSTPVIRIVQGADCPGFVRAFEHHGPVIKDKQEDTVFRHHLTRGVFEISVQQARNVYKAQLFGKQDLFARVRMGKQKFHSEIQKDGDDTAEWKEGCVNFSITDEDVYLEFEVLRKMLGNRRIGACALLIDDLMSHGLEEHTEWYPLLRKCDQKAGEILVTTIFHAPTTITIHECKGLRKVQILGTQSPYVKIKVANGQFRFLSSVVKKGGKNPQWNDEEGSKFDFNPMMIDQEKAGVIDDDSEDEKKQPVEPQSKKMSIIDQRIALLQGQNLDKDNKDEEDEEDDVPECSVEFKVKNSFLKDSLIGYAKIPLSTLHQQRRGEPKEHELQKSPTDTEAAGSIFLSVKHKHQKKQSSKTKQSSKKKQ